MAYFYYCTDQHSHNAHNDDVYVLANSEIYHDDNGESEEWSGWILNGGHTFTIGGNYGNGTYNIYQGSGWRAYTQSTVESATTAVMFNGDGTLRLASQTGAGDTGNLEFSDDLMKFKASHKLKGSIVFYAGASSGASSAVENEENWGKKGYTWDGDGTQETTSGSTKAMTYGSILDGWAYTAEDVSSSIFKASGALKVKGDFRGSYEVESKQYSVGVIVRSTSPHVEETAQETKTNATGVSFGTTLTIQGNAVATLEAESRGYFRSINDGNLHDNEIVAYGFKGTNDSDAITTFSLTNGVLGGQTVSRVYSTTIAATNGYAYDKDKGVAESSKLSAIISNTLVEAAAIKAGKIAIAVISPEMNDDLEKDVTVSGGTLDKNTVIYSEVKDTALLAGHYGDDTKNTLTNNKIRAVGLAGEDSISIDKFDEDGVIQVNATGNRMQVKSADLTTAVISGNEISAIAIEGGEINLKNFEGTLRVVMSNNDMDNFTLNDIDNKDTMITAGILASTRLNVNSNLNGTINIQANNNTFDLGQYTEASAESSRWAYAHYSAYVAGISSEENITVQGQIATDIDITVTNDCRHVYGIFADKMLTAMGFSGDINVSVQADFSSTVMGLYAKNFRSLAGTDTAFQISGNIAVSVNAFLSQAAGVSYPVAVACDGAMNLTVSGNVSATSTSTKAYAFRSDYLRSVYTGFNDDSLTFAAGAVVNGMVNLGGGQNELFIDSNASFTGSVEHDVGEINVTFLLNGEAGQNAIQTVTSTEDTVLATGSTLTLNLNDAKAGQSYILVDYSQVSETASKRWNNGSVTLAYQGNTQILSLGDHKGSTIIGDDPEDRLAVEVKYENDQLIATVKNTSVVATKDQPAATLNVNAQQAASITAASGVDATALLEAYKEKLGEETSVAEATIKYTQDEVTAEFSTQVTLTWFGKYDETTLAPTWELEYTIQDGANASKNYLTIDGKKSYKAENTIEVNGEKWVIYQYELTNLKDSGEVSWNVRQNEGDGNMVSAWTAGSEALVEQTVELVSESPIKNMAVISPDDESKGIVTSMAQFTWNPVESTYAIDHYTLQYFESATDLSKTDEGLALKQAMFDYAEAIFALNDNYWHQYQDETAGTFEAKKYDDGTVRVRKETATAGEYTYYNFYQKTTSDTSILASALSNQMYVYWRVKSTDIKGNDLNVDSEGNKYTEGTDFRVYLGDVTGPTWSETPTLSVSAPVYSENNTWTVSNVKWEMVNGGDPNATDTQSGIRRYKFQYTTDGWKTYTTLYNWGESELFVWDATTEKYKFKEDLETEVVFEESGTYTCRVVAVDAAGNAGAITSEKVIYAQDTLAPIATAVKQTRKAFTKDGRYYGYDYTFDWDAMGDNPDKTKNVVTGVQSYTVAYYYYEKDQEDNKVYIGKLYGLNENNQYELIATADPNSGMTLTGREVTLDDGSVGFYVTDKDQTYTHFRLTLHDLDEEGNPTSLETADFEEYCLSKDATGKETNRVYHLAVKAADQLENTVTPYDKNLNIDDAPDESAPTGAFGTLTTPVVEVTKRTTVETEEGEEEETGTPLEATMTFKWTDSYVDNDGSVAYIMQVSDSNSFEETAKNTTFVVMEGSVYDSLSADDRKKLLEKVQETYEDARLLRGETKDTDTQYTVILDNTKATAPVGVLSGISKGYWRMKAMDTNGNMTNTWSATTEFSFTDSETEKVIKDTTKPETPVITGITGTYTKQKYTGAITLTVTSPLSGFGVDYFVVDYQNTKTKAKASVTLSNLTQFTQSGSRISSDLGLGTTLADGYYSFTVTAYGATNLKSTSAAYTWIQDTQAPTTEVDEAGMKVQAISGAAGNAKVYLTWAQFTDNISDSKNIRYEVSYKEHSSDGWNTLGTFTETTATLELTENISYDFKLQAIDEKGNYTKVYSLEDQSITSQDLDPEPYELTSGETIAAQTVGGGDTSDSYTMAVEDVGHLKLNFCNLKNLENGSGLTVTIYKEDQTTVLKTYSIALNNTTKSTTGQDYITLMDSIGDSCYIVVKASGKSSAIMQYTMTAEYEQYVADPAKHNSPYTTAKKMDEVENENKWTADGRIGYGDDYAYIKFEAASDGKYTLNIGKQSEENSDLTVALYKAENGKVKLTSVKSVTLSATSEAGALKDMVLSAGTYYIKVLSTKASKGGNVNYELTMAPSDNVGNLFTSDIQNNEDDFFANLGRDYQPEGYDDEMFSYSTNDLDDNSLMLTSSGDKAILPTTGEAEYDWGWLGYGDALDFRKVTVETAGVFDLTLTKNEDYGNHGDVTVTVYKLSDPTKKTSLTKVKSITVKAKDATGVLADQVWDTGTYYIGIQSTAASKGDSIFYQLELTGELSNAEGWTLMDSASASEVISISEAGKKVLTGESEQIAGLGGANQYYTLVLQHDGKYTLNIAKDVVDTTESPLAVTVYAVNASGSGLTSKKSYTLANKTLSSDINLGTLAGGTYVVRVTASNASKGQYAGYTLTLNSSELQEESYTQSNESFLNATEMSSGTASGTFEATQLNEYYQFATGVKAGQFTFTASSDKALTYTLYSLKDGAVSLTKVASMSLKAGATQETKVWLDDNTTYYVGISGKAASAGAGYNVTIGADAAKNISDYLADDNWAELADGDTLTPGVEWESWVGYGSLVSARKLDVASAGSYNFTLLKDEEDGTAVTLDLYTLNANGTALTKVKSLSVAASKAEGTLTNLLLGAGTYYAIVTSKTAKGSSDFTVNIGTTFTATTSDNSSLATAEQVEVNGDFTLDSKWVGYTDEYDYYQLNLGENATGYYTFSVKASDVSKYTLYSANRTTGDLTALQTVSVSSKQLSTQEEEKYVDFKAQVLDASMTYFVVAQSTNASKGGNATYFIEAGYAAIANGNDATEFTVAANTKAYGVRFTVDADNAGKYTFYQDDTTAGLLSNAKIYQYSDVNGKMTKLSVDKSANVNLTEGIYYLELDCSKSAEAQEFDFGLDMGNKRIQLAYKEA